MLNASGVLAVGIQSQYIAVGTHFDAERFDGRLEHGVTGRRAECEGVIDVLLSGHGGCSGRHAGVDDRSQSQRGALVVVHRQLSIDVFHRRSRDASHLQHIVVISYLRSDDDLS